MIFCMFSCSVVRTTCLLNLSHRHWVSLKEYLSNKLCVFSVLGDLCKCFPLFCKLPALRLRKADISTEHFASIRLLNEASVQDPKKAAMRKVELLPQFLRNTVDLEVWSRIMNDPRRTNSGGCADSLGDDRLGHDGCCRDQTCETPRCRLVLSTSRVKGSFNRAHLGFHRKPSSPDTPHNSVSCCWPC